MLSRSSLSPLSRLLFRRAFSAAAASNKLVLYEQKDKVGVITLNEPARLNALTVEMGEHFSEVLSSIDYSKTNALVLTGSGKAFSAGGDLNFLRKRSNDTGMRNAIIMKRFYASFLGQLRQTHVPVVAAINGPAVGAGLCFALGADIRVASKSARLGVTFVGLGLHAGMGCTYTLPRLIGPQLASYLLLTGKLVTGEEAARMGLVMEATEDDQCLPTALKIANEIASQAPVAVRSTMRSVRLNVDDPASLDRALYREADAQSYSYSTADLKEGVEAVAEKRKAAFKNQEKYD